MQHEKDLKELEERRRHALSMGGSDKIRKREAEGKLNARQRIDRVLDPGSFLEVGMFNHSDMPGAGERTPADGKVGGYGEIDGRRVVIYADDFTVLSGTTSRVACRKETELKLESERRGIPLIYLAECGGARMPDIMGAKELASFGGGGFDSMLRHLTRVRFAPMVTALLGACYGNPMWHASLSDFVVQVKGSVLAVSGPRILELALGESVAEEDLGGWKVHAEITGVTDRVAEDEEECFGLIRRYLNYMPSNCEQPLPRSPIPEGSGLDMERILEYLPEQRNRAYDMNRILECLVDKGTLFPLKPLFGNSLITTLARISGRVVGIVANQPMFQAGAMDTDGIDKAISFLCLCDTFNIPLIFLQDNPGFLVGKAAERKRVGSRVINFLNALGLVSVPKISVIVRKAYGMAFWNMGGSGCASDFLVAWPTAEMNFVDPEIAANVVYGGRVSEDGKRPEEWERAVEKMRKDSSPFGAAAMHYIHDVIDPRETRAYIERTLQICQDSHTRGMSRHALANWPTKF